MKSENSKTEGMYRYRCMYEIKRKATTKKKQRTAASEELCTRRMSSANLSGKKDTFLFLMNLK